MRAAGAADEDRFGGLGAVNQLAAPHPWRGIAAEAVPPLVLQFLREREQPGGIVVVAALAVFVIFDGEADVRVERHQVASSVADGEELRSHGGLEQRRSGR